MEIKGLHCFVYRNTLGDSTANGLSSKKDSLLLVTEFIDAPFSPKDGEDYLVLTFRPQFKDFIATPKSIIDSKKHPMFGGNFIYTSDTRFPSDSPIKIFDRVEY